MRHLYLKLYLTVVASLVVFVLAAGFLWRQLVAASPPPGLDLAAEVAQGAQQAALEQLAAHRRINIALYAPDGTRIAQVGPDLLARRVEPRGQRGPWHPGRVWSLELPDGRWLVARLPRRERPPYAPWGLYFTLGLIALGVAVGAYPVVRGATRRRSVSRRTRRRSYVHV